MIGRNIASLFFKMKNLFNEKEREELKIPSKLFVHIILIITAIAGIVCGVTMLFPNLIFPYYLFFVVSGMMIYSYFSYAGITFQEKNWFMFGLCIVVIIFTSTLSGFLGYYMATGIID
jgi:hypothetical protein